MNCSWSDSRSILDIYPLYPQYIENISGRSVRGCSILDGYIKDILQYERPFKLADK